MKLWPTIIAVVVGAAILAAVAGYYFRPSITTIDPSHELKAADDEQQVEQKDAAIRSLSAEIARLRALANQEAAARMVAEGASQAFAQRAAELSSKVAALEAAAKTRPPINSRMRALQVIRDLGY